MTTPNRRKRACVDCGADFTGKAFRGRCRACFKKVVMADGGLPAVGIDTANRVERAKRGRPPTDPTHFEPGSDGKKEVMRLRAGRGECLFHPDDAKGGDATDLNRWHSTDGDDDDEG